MYLNRFHYAIRINCVQFKIVKLRKFFFPKPTNKLKNEKVDCCFFVRYAFRYRILHCCYNFFCDETPPTVIYLFILCYFLIYCYDLCRRIALFIEKYDVSLFLSRSGLQKAILLVKRFQCYYILIEINKRI